MERGIEIRLYNHFPDGCSVLATPNRLVVSLQIDQPWSHVLQQIEGEASVQEKFRVRLLFESYVRERTFEVREDFIALVEWPPRDRTEAGAISDLNL